MRRFFVFLTLLFSAYALQAQTIESSKWYENTFVTVAGGGITTNLTNTHEKFFWDGAKDVVKSVRPVAAFEIGKYVTPVVGFSFEGQAMFNTTRVKTFVDQSNVIANVKFNLSNFFGGYLGQPRRIEFVAVPGLGWGHNYGNILGIDKNYLTYNTGLEVNVNLGKDRTWQFNIKPAAVWNNYNNVLHFDRNNLQVRVLAGITKKFGNFKLCPYSVTAADYNALQGKVKDLENALAAKPKEVEVEKVVIKEVVVEKEVPANEAITINFEKGESKLFLSEMVELNNYVKGLPKDAHIVVTGSADSKTGNAKTNKKLAEDRAKAVQKYLNDKGYTNVDIDTEIDVFENRVRSRVAVIK